MQIWAKMIVQLENIVVFFVCGDHCPSCHHHRSQMLDNRRHIDHYQKVIVAFDNFQLHNALQFRMPPIECQPERKQRQIFLAS
jgi:hypothetical protein